MVLSSGEIPLEAKLTEDRGASLARDNWSACWIFRAGTVALAFSTMPDADDDAGELARGLQKAASKAYGTAGPEFVRRILDEQVMGDDVGAMVADFR